MPTPFITIDQTSEITRRTIWTEFNYKRYIEKCKKFGTGTDEMAMLFKQTAEFLSKYSLDDVLKYWDYEDHDEIPSMSFKFSGGYINTSSLIDIVKEAMIDENCDGEIVHDSGCDEFSTEWEVVK